MTGETAPKILVKQLTEPITPISESRPGLPQTLAAAIDRCVKKDPAERFSTAEELIEAIDAGQLSEPDIPLPIRLFAGELGTLSLIAVGIALFTYFVVQAAEQQQLASLPTESGTPSASRLARLEARLAELERQQRERPR